MEMLKKLVIVLAITGLCAVKAAEGTWAYKRLVSDRASLGSVSLSHEDFFHKSVEEIREDIARGIPLCTGIRQVLVKSQDYPEGIFEEVDLEQESNDKRFEAEKECLHVPIEIEAFKIRSCIEKSKKNTGFAFETITTMNELYGNMYKLLSAENNLSFGAKNQMLLIKYDQPRKQVKALIDKSLKVHKEIDTLLLAGKNWKHQRSSETEELINNHLDNLKNLYEKMEKLFVDMRNTERQEIMQGSDRQRTGSNGQKYTEGYSQGYIEWCASGRNPAEYQ